MPRTEHQKALRREHMRKYVAKNRELVYARNRDCRRRLSHQWPSQARDIRLRAEKRCDAKRRLDPVRQQRYLEVCRANQKRRRVRLRKEVMAAYGGKCACCGEGHIEFLTLDHINEDGAQRRKNGEPRGGIPFWRWAKKNGYPRDLQALCWNCNMAKHQQGICPHKLAKI